MGRKLKKRLLYLTLLYVLIISCNGGSGGFTGPEGVPKISNIQVSPTTIPKGQAFNVKFDYLDEDNDLGEGIIRMTTEVPMSIYSQGNLMTGDLFNIRIEGIKGAQGTISLSIMIDTSTSPGKYSFNIQVIDKTGDVSNILRAYIDIT